MGNRQLRWMMVLLVAAALWSAGYHTILQAQTSANFDLGWSVIVGGGGNSSSTNFRVQGTTGQGLVMTSQGEDHIVSGGFWYPMLPESYKSHLPVTLR
jgi:hypothetical protein